MDKIILGLLMIKQLTIYELRNLIETNFTSMCSNSMGSIQAAIKKLLDQNMIVYKEFVENSVNKKVYTLTDTGSDSFLKWVQTSMSAGKVKDMELSKLFFMGFVPAMNRRSLIEAHLADLKIEKAQLEHIKKQDFSKNKLQYSAYIEKDHIQKNLLQNAIGHTTLKDGIDDITEFELLTLQFGIDRVNFEIEWYEQLKNRTK